MIKIITMNANTLIWAVLKPALRKKFNLKDLHKVTFIANTIEDTLDLEAVGICSKELIEKKQNTQTLKLSDNKEYINLYLEQIKQQLKFNKLNACYLRIDFINKKVSSDVFYLNENNTKTSATINLKF